jgi:spore germination cell wall hydrolase CwlJ-like protein|tara:strand:- start:964 stop:1530 length:567 start_codon:yes stop_codon:yes gene_type:complete
MNKLLTVSICAALGILFYAIITDGDAASFDEDTTGVWSSEDNPWENAVGCLAEAIYFEAGNQPIVGKLAVGNVIINRMYSPQYPDKICDVVHQGPVRESWKKNGVFYPIKHKCQFSYWCDGKSDIPKFGPTWDDSSAVAYWILADNDLDYTYLDIVEGATHYHAVYVTPGWSYNLQKVVKIQDHIFYK